MIIKISIIVIIILLCCHLCPANPLPIADIAYVNSSPPEIGLWTITLDPPVDMSGDSIITSGGIAIIDSGVVLTGNWGDEPYILDSTNTSGFILNPEADSIVITTLIWELQFFRLHYGTFGSAPPPIVGHYLDLDLYYSDHGVSNPASYITSFDFSIPDLGWTDVVINEINAHGSWGENSNFVELFNRSDFDIGLDGWRIVCDTIYDLPGDAVITSGGFYVIDQVDFPSMFDLDFNADNIYLINPNPIWILEGNRRVDQVGWSTDHGENVSFMRYPDGDADSSGYMNDYWGYSDVSSTTFENGFPSRGAANRHESPGFVVIGASADSVGECSACIHWTDPIWDDNFELSIVVRSTTGYPETPEDGDLIYQGTDQEFTHTDIPPDQLQYYSIFAKDINNEYSTPTEESQTSIIFGGYPYLPGDVNMYFGIWPPAVIGSDVTYLVSYFRSIPTNIPCRYGGFWSSADINGDCLVIGSDVTRLVSYFRGIVDIEYCPDYTPLWLTPDDLPVEAPTDWPGCQE